jgi:hypothetical protein
MTAVTATENITVTAPAPTKSHLWDGSSFGFTDILGALNPLQHLPIIGTIYRAVTGDTIGNVARVVGDGLYGGLLGVASGAIDVATSEATGKDIGQHVLDTIEDLFSSKHDDKPAPPQPAQQSDPLMAAAQAQPDAPKLPQLGSASTASALAAAAPISPLTAPKLAAQAEAQAQQSATPPGAIRPLNTPGQPIPIDVSARGIAMMRATSATHNARPVPLNLPAGALPPQSAGSGASAPASDTATVQPAAVTQGDFAERMRAGLAKYDALMAAQARNGQPSNVDQVH